MEPNILSKLARGGLAVRVSRWVMVSHLEWTDVSSTMGNEGFVESGGPWAGNDKRFLVHTGISAGSRTV